MIQITRSLVRQVRAVFRRIARRTGNLSQALVGLTTGPDGLKVQLHRTDVAIEFRQEGNYPAEQFAISINALNDFEGRSDEIVMLEKVGENTVLARWQDGAVPQSKEVASVDFSVLAKFPDLPTKMVPCEPDLWKALTDADDATSSETARYALTRIQFRGSAGDIVATDGKQLLAQTGFTFPWTENLLVHSPVSGCRELPADGPFHLGKSADHVTLQVGRWALHFPIDKEGRFPEVEHVIPSLTNASTCQIDQQDADFLSNALPRLPGAEDSESPITVDLNGQVTIRAKAADQSRVTELTLAGSKYSGKATRFACNRILLKRALELGFQQISVVNADTPVVFTDDHRKFVVMSLGKNGVLESGEDAVRISSPSPQPVSKPIKEEKKISATPVPTPVPSEAASDKVTSAPPISSDKPLALARNGHRVQIKKPLPGGINGLLEEAQEIKSVLRNTFSRMNQLIGAIKKHRKQNRLVQATIESLRQLKRVGA